MRNPDYYFISDPHIGNRGPQDDCHWDALGSLVFKIMKKDDILWVLGDMFELLQCSATEIFQAYGKDLKSIADRVRIHLVLGNHDTFERLESTMLLALLTDLRVTIYPEGLTTLQVGRLNILLAHGHQYDDVIANFPLFARWFAKAGGVLEKVYPDIDRLWSKMEAFFFRKGRHSENYKYYDTLSAIANLKQCSHAIFGHTHKPVHTTACGIGIDNNGAYLKGNKEFFYNFVSGENPMLLEQRKFTI